MSVAKQPSDTDSTAWRQLPDYAKVGIPIAIVFGITSIGMVLGPASAVLALAGCSLVAVILIFWSSLRTLLGETPLSGADAYALGAPRAEEEQKQAVLRALKDLEFEKSVGKISEEDYREQVTRLRAEGKRLLRILDTEAEPGRKRAEVLVAKHLRRAGLVEGAQVVEEEEEEDKKPDEAAKAPRKKARKRKPTTAKETVSKQEVPVETREEEEGLRCATCGTMNDEDAIFCKKCGARQQKATSETAQEDGDEA